MLKLPIWKFNSNLRFLNSNNTNSNFFTFNFKNCRNFKNCNKINSINIIRYYNIHSHTNIENITNNDIDTFIKNQFKSVLNEVLPISYTNKHNLLNKSSFIFENTIPNSKGLFATSFHNSNLISSRRYYSMDEKFTNKNQQENIDTSENNKPLDDSRNETEIDINQTNETNKTIPKQTKVTENDKLIKNEIDKKELTRLFTLIKSDWKLLFFALSLLLISVSIGMSIPKVIGLVLDALKDFQLNGDNNDTLNNFNFNDLQILNFTLNQFIGITFGALLIGCFANYIRVILLRLLSERLVVRLRSNLINKIFHQDATFFDKYKVGDLISRVSNDAHMVSRSITQKISDGCKSTIICIGGISLMFTLSVPLSLSLMIVMGPTFLFIAKIFGKQIRLNAKELQETTANLTKVTEEQFNGIKTIQSFVSENNELRKFHNSVRNIFRVGKESAFINAKFYTGASVISDFSFLVVLSYGSYLVFNNSLTIGDLTAFMLYAEYTGNAIFNFLSFYSELMQGAGAASRLFELMDYNSVIKPTIGNKFKLTRNDRGADITFNDVSFAYPTRPNTPIFKNLSFKIESGSNVCIVGPSGKGKSTIAWLLLHYYNPSAGKILIDGQDISNISPKSLRRQIGIVQQEPILMSGTIRDNITYGLTEKVSKERIRSVAKQCFCHGFITKLPDTYDTMTGPQGTMLSGGQKQRIAIARALIKDPKILILDEATSALDVESEGAINYTFGQLMKSKSLTIVSIAHRLSTIRRSENIIVLGNEGNVVETGKFKELFADPNSQLSRLLNENRNDVSKTTNSPESVETEEKNDKTLTKKPNTNETIPNEINEVLKDISREAIATPAQIPSNDNQI